MKVLFLTAPELPRRSLSPVIPPLASLLLTSKMRRSGHEVEQRDLDVRIVQDPELLQECEAHPILTHEGDFDAYFGGTATDAVLDGIADRLLDGISLEGFGLIALSSKRPLGVRLIAKRVRERCAVPIMVGGELQNDPLGIIRSNPAIDYLVEGKGEVPLIEYLAAAERGTGLETVPCLYRRRDGEIRQNAGRSETIQDVVVPDLRGLPIAPYLLQPALLNQLANPGLRIVIPHQFIHGCPYRCVYCQVTRSRSCEHKDPVQIVDELQWMVESTGCHDFAFFNNTINIATKFVQELCREIIRRDLKIRWSDSATFGKASDDDLELMRASGCICLTFGLESGSNRILRLMRKAHTQEMAERVLRKTHALGIWNRINIIVGFPGETDADYQESVRFVERTGPLLDSVAISCFYLVPSDLLKQPERYGIELHERTRRADNRNVLSSFAFDETGGPRWDEREKIAYERRERLNEVFIRAHGRTREITNLYEIHDVFSYCRDKAEVRHHLLDERRGFRFLLFTGADCNNGCADCPTRNLPPGVRPRTLADLCAEIENARSNGYSRLVLVGGEPTLRPDFSELLEYLHRQRLDRVVLVTNGRRLAYPRFASTLRHRGIDHVVFKLRGRSRETLEAVTQVPGSYEQSMRGISNWEALGGEYSIIDGPVIGPAGARALPGLEPRER